MLNKFTQLYHAPFYALCMCILKIPYFQMGEIIGLKLNQILMDVLKEENQFGRQRRILGFLK